MDQTMGLVVYIAFFIGLIYLMIIRPQKKEKARKEALMTSLQKGADIVTYSGIHGTVTSIDSNKGIIVVNVAKGVEITMEKAAVARVLETKEAE
ncbi:preprotein translocase subunit YajC [Clostridia bacterium]|nr:preprotein translocase subunit YajC [Clostridia bacterium]